MRRLLLASLLLVSCVGKSHAETQHLCSADSCALPPKPIYWSFSAEFPRELYRDVRSGFDFWDELTPRHLFQEVGSTDSRSRIVIRRDRMVRKRGDNMNVMAITQLPSLIDGSTVITFYDSYAVANRNMRISVSRHEVLHALGFDHTADPRCLMLEVIPWEDVRHGPKAPCQQELDDFKRRYVTWD